MELHEHRALLMQENLSRLGVEAECRVWDASKILEEQIEAFDRFLIDAPCSALGLLYRKPDIKYTKHPEEIQMLAETQRAILSACAQYVKPGGRLIYSTCTISQEENDQNIDWFLEHNRQFSQVNLAAVLPERLMSRARDGRLQLFPHLDCIDGFFLAVLEREKR